MKTTVEGFEILRTASEIIERTTWDGTVRICGLYLFTNEPLECKVGWATIGPANTRKARSFADCITQAAEIADFITGLGLEIDRHAEQTKVTRENYEEALEEIEAALYNKDAEAIGKWLEI